MNIFYLTSNPFFWILAAGLLLQLIIYLGFFLRLAIFKVNKSAEPEFTESVSVIIAAQNEEDNLRNNLPLICEQDYPVFEVIVVNDQSEDDTKYVLEEFSVKYSHLRILTIDEHVKEFAGKKLALTLAIKASKYDYLVMTDADCTPTSDQWLKSISRHYSNPDTEIVIGFSPYRSKTGLLNALIRYDTFYTALQYFSLALAGIPYMGVGRNLSYKKDLFFRNKGFAPFLKISSGDDDLFVNRVATKENTAVALGPGSFMITEPKKTWYEWLHQKRRHQQTGKLYKKSHKRILGFIWLSNFIFYTAIILGFIFITPWWVAGGALGIKLLIQLTVNYFSLKKLKMMNLMVLTPIIDFFYQLLYLPIIGIAGLFFKPKKTW